LLGSPQDGVIQPWQSAFFGFWDAQGNLINMTEQTIYTQDYIGLLTLDKQGKLHQNIAPNVPHEEWVTNSQVFVDYILPWLT
jgi:palmitoyl-protein thioesterase